MTEWVRRKAKADLACDGCWSSIRTCDYFYLCLDGTRLCCECPPEEDNECQL